jgi:hypothetical protein
LSDLQKKLFLFFIQFWKQAAQLREIISVPSLASPIITILWLFESSNRCRRLAVVGTSELRVRELVFKRANRWNGVIVFHARDVTPQQARSLLNVTLR